MLLALCKISGPVCAVCPHHARAACPGLGATGGETGRGRGVRGFCSGRILPLGIPLAESSAPQLAVAQLGFGACCLAASPSPGLPTHAPSPHRPCCGSGDRAQGDTGGGTYGAAAAPVGELQATLAGVPEQGPCSRCRLINLGQIDELAACWVGGLQPLSGECTRPWGLLRDGPPVSLLTCGLEERGFGEEEELLLLQDAMLPPVLPRSGPRAPPCRGSLPANPQAGMRHPWAPQNLKAGSNQHLLVLLAWLCSPGKSQLKY